MIRRLGPLLRLELVRMRRSKRELFSYLLMPAVIAIGATALPAAFRSAPARRVTVHATGLQGARSLAGFLRANGVRLVAERDPRARLIRGAASVGLVISPGFDEALGANRRPSLTLLYLDDDGQSRARMLAVARVLERYRTRQLAWRIQRLGGAPEMADSFKLTVEAAEASIRGARLRLAQRVPFVLLLALGSVLPASAVIFFALRGNRTIEVLFSQPYWRHEIFVAFVTSWLLRGMTSMASASGVMWIVPKLLEPVVAVSRPTIGDLVVSWAVFLPVGCLIMSLGMLMGVTCRTRRSASMSVVMLASALSGMALKLWSSAGKIHGVWMLPIVGQFASTYNFLLRHEMTMSTVIVPAAACLVASTLLMGLAGLQLERRQLVLRSRYED